MKKPNINLNKIKLYRYLCNNYFNLVDTLPKQYLKQKECRGMWSTALLTAIRNIRLLLNNDELYYLMSAYKQELDVISNGSECTDEFFIEELINSIDKIRRDQLTEMLKQLLGKDYEKYGKKIEDASMEFML